jgi:phage terminase large subunit-like protein
MELLLSQRLGLEAEERGGGSGRTHLAQYWKENICALPKPTDHLVVGVDPSAGLGDPFAVVSVWEDNDCYYAFSRQFLLRVTFDSSHKTLKNIYQKAIDTGELSLHESPSVMEDAVRAYCLDLLAKNPSAHFCGDAAGLAGFKERFEETIASYKSIPQGWQLNAALDRAGGLAFEKRMKHGGQPLLSANVANLVQENGKMRKFDASSNGVGSAKIDGCMAMLSAILEISTSRRFDASAICG